MKDILLSISSCQTFNKGLIVQEQNLNKQIKIKIPELFFTWDFPVAYLIKLSRVFVLQLEKNLPIQ